MQLRLFGQPVSHSLSPCFQNRALEVRALAGSYRVEEVDEEGLRAGAQRVREGALRGANVTLPHKRLAAELADLRSASAQSAGAANTWWSPSAGVLQASNTDVWGVRALVQAAGVPCPRSLVILGCGGAGAAAAWALAPSLERLWLLNRSAEGARRLASSLVRVYPELRVSAHTLEELAGREGPELREGRAPPGGLAPSEGLASTEGLGDTSMGGLGDAQCVIDATSLRHLAPEASAQVASQLPWQALGRGTSWIDLSYGRKLAPLAAEAERLGLPVFDGASMLLHQGAVSFSLWTGDAAPLAEMAAALAGALRRPANRLPTFASLVEEGVAAERQGSP